MSDLIVVPRWLLDGLTETAAASPDAQQLLLRFERWQAHVGWNPSLFGNIVADMDRMRGELAAAAAILRGDGPLQGSLPLVKVDARAHGSRAEAELKAERATRLDRPVRD